MTIVSSALLRSGTTVLLLLAAVTPLRAQTQVPNQPPAKAPPAAKAQPQPPADPVALMRQMTELFVAGKYEAAIPVSKQLIAVFEGMGMREHPLQAQNYAALGNLYRFTGNFAEAERTYRRALAMREKLFGTEHADIAASLDDLHQLAAVQGQYADAERLLARVLAMRERLLPADDPQLSMTRISVARLHALQGRHELAEPLIRAALDIFRQKLGPEHPYLGVAINNLADTLSALGRYAEAEPLLLTAVDMMEKAAGPKSPLAAVALNNLSELYREQGRVAEAEELRRREITILEAAVGPESPELARSLNNFGILLSAQRRPKEAEALLRRALAIQEKYFKPDHPDIPLTLNNLAEAVGQAGRRDEAEQLYRRSLAARERALGPNHRSVALALYNLAGALIEQDKFSDAEPLSRRVLAINEREYPPGHPQIARSFHLLGTTLDHLGRHGEAKPLLERALEMRRDTLGADHPDVAVSLLNLGSNALDRGDWQAAYDTLSKAAVLWQRRQSVMQASGKQPAGELEVVRNAYLGLAVAAERLRSQPGQDGERLMAAAWDAVQESSQTIAATALARASARAATRDPRLAALVRERQDIAEQVTARDQLLLAELGKLKAERNQTQIDGLHASLATLAARGSALDLTLARDFPDHAALAAAKPLPLKDAQALLAADEALVVIAPARLGTLVWAVTRDRVTWVRADLTGKQATAKVSALRCGLDFTRWTAGDGGAACLKIGNRGPEDNLLPFDPALAHELYRTLFAPIEDVIRGRHLLLSVSDALTTLPFHVLVTEPPPAGATLAERLKDLAWLGKRQPLTMLASVASLKAQRQRGGDRAAKPFLAFANPLLVGDAGSDRRAFDRQSCPKGVVTAQARVALRAMPDRPPMRRSLDIEDLRSAAPLPETTDEVCAVGAALGALETDIHLGARATVRTIKQLAQRGVLADYRVVHFASHGLVAGGRSALEQILTEPAILLTPPPKGTTGRALAEDDGLLRASDVAALKLNADWVVLSACNTASGSATHAEPLAGLARAFFHAGTRALLVSHWEVDSDAAVKLVTRAFAEIARDPKTTRARALQIAMSELIAAPEPRVSHPAHWAPFVVVGDGR